MPLSGVIASRGLVLCLILLPPADPGALPQAAQTGARAEAALRERGSGAAAPYLALLRRYEQGDYDGAAAVAVRIDVRTARRLGRLVIDEIDRDIVQIRRLRATSGTEAPTSHRFHEFRRERARRLKLTLLVHTEAALLVSDDVRALGQQLALAREAAQRLRRLEADFRDNGPLAIVVGQPDPRLDDPESASRRAALGRQEWEQTSLIVRDWYLVIASRLQSNDYQAFLKKHVDEGLELFGDDAGLLLARGSIAESEADSAVVDRSLSDAIYKADHLQRWRRLLTAARGDYDAAIGRRADLHEAALRRGRVSGLLEDREAARRDLDAVAGGDGPAPLRYLAQMFLGDLAEREHHLGKARAAYEAALVLYPTAQAPMLALSLLCDGAVEAGCARDWLSKSMTAVRRGRRDPWWDYQRGQAALGDDRLAALRARGLRP